MPSVADLVAQLGGDILASRELQERLRASQPTVSRLLKAAGGRVVRIGRGPATRYGVACDVFELARGVPLFAVDEAGLVKQLAVLRGIAEGYVVEAGGGPSWLLGEGGAGLFGSLPYFLHDLRPSGFLGRLLARRLATEWDFPADPRSWSDVQIGQYLVRLGEDLPGHLVVGEAAAARIGRQRTPPVEGRELEYPQLALRVLGAGPPGSSAAGEQPKFAVEHAEAGHVLVKFSPDAASADAQRWRDLLHAEHQALSLLVELDVPAAATAVYSFGQRIFLESRRFDRRGARGRAPALSLAALDAEYVGEGYGWTRVGRGLHDRGLLDGTSLERIAWLESFGAWIGNTDMHLGNISLAPTADGFSLLPVYDMVPMAFAPVRGELPEVQLPPPIRTAANETAWAAAGQAAATLWLRLADDPRLSDVFRGIAQNHGQRWKDLL